MIRQYPGKAFDATYIPLCCSIGGKHRNGMILQPLRAHCAPIVSGVAYVRGEVHIHAYDDWICFQGEAFDATFQSPLRMQVIMQDR